MFLKILIILSFLANISLHSQGKREDFLRSETLYKGIHSKLTRNEVDLHWSADESYLWYKVNVTQNSYAFFVLDLKSGQKRKAFDSGRLANALTNIAESKFNLQNLPINYIEFENEYKTFRFSFMGKSYQCELPSYTIKPAKLKDTKAKNLTKIEASKGSSNKSSIKVINSTDSVLNMEWVDLQGRRKSYGSIAPGKSKQISSFKDHVWSITNNKKLPVKIIRLAYSDEVIEITSKTPLKIPKNIARNSSPNGKWQSFVKENNLFLREKSSGKIFQLSKDGNSQDSYTNNYYWSPDSKKLICIKEKRVKTRQISIVESSPKDQLQPKLHTLNYAKPGDPLPFKRPQLFDVEAKTQIQLDEKLYENPYSNSRFRWKDDSSEFTFLHNRRGHQTLRLISINAQNGTTKALIDEQSKTFVHYSGKTYLKHLDGSNEIIWMSERSGWNHLYLIDGKSGSIINPITKGKWIVRKVIDVDTDARQIIFEAGCLNPNQDPYHIHLCRVNFDGTAFTRLTEADGTHSYKFSPNRKFLHLTWSRVDKAPVNEVRRVSDGKHISTLEETDWSALLKTGWKVPIRFKAKGRDGETDIWGIIILPSNFDPAKKYPVIEQIYAGPHGSHVPKSFSTLSRQHKLAELGFIVVQIDGMGTNNRSKAFHDVCWKNLGDGGFPDRIKWMEAAALKYPQMDISRVGIYGGSAGGQNALRALLAYGNFYKAAAADCGCHDNRMDKIWWNEQWMGWPIDKHYDEQSNVTQAHKLNGKLLLTVGELDKNVDPASTMQVVKALIDADKDFELIVFPGKGHGIGWSKYGTKRIYKFFIRSLYGIEADF